MSAYSALEKALPMSMFPAPGRPVRPRRPRPSQGLLPIFVAEIGLAAACSRPADRNGAGRPAANGSIDRSLAAAESSVSVGEAVPATEDLYGWVGERMARIRGHARKYLAYSPYEMDEFVQQAYETALLAREDCLRRGAPADIACFEKMFWSSFRIACLRMTYTHGKKAVISHEEYQESGDENAPATQTPAEVLIGGGEDISETSGAGPGRVDELTPAQKRAFARQVLALMTPREKLAWEHILAGRTRRQAARSMGITRQSVQDLLRWGIKRAKRLAVHSDFRSQLVRTPRRPKPAASVPAQHYLPIIEKSFSARTYSA